jgi:hypothetical protein
VGTHLARCDMLTDVIKDLRYVLCSRPRRNALCVPLWATTRLHV